MKGTSFTTILIDDFSRVAAALAERLKAIFASTVASTPELLEMPEPKGQEDDGWACDRVDPAADFRRRARKTQPIQKPTMRVKWTERLARRGNNRGM